MTTQDFKDYERLLDRARERIPEDAFKRERFEIPDVQVMIQGRATVIKNFQKIVDLVDRPTRHFLKFILQEVGTAGDIRGGQAILKGLFKKDNLKAAINHYIETYVLCPVCNKPDTELKKRGKQELKICHACGAETIPKL
ncbi:MAG: translation initiation factor IF-2 subunit beta [Promethearchaeota archaeon]